MVRMNKLTINVDMDGVIYDMMSELAVLANSQYAQEHYDFGENELTVRPETWDIAAAWGMPSKGEFWRFFYWAVDHGLFVNGKPIHNAIEIVGNLVQAKHRVRIVTSKRFSDAEVTKTAQEDVIKWLYNNAPEWSHKVEVAFTGNKQGYDADIIIDDKPTLAWTQLGKVNILFDHTWNQDVNSNPVGMFPMQPHLYRAMSWEQVEYLVGRASVKWNQLGE
jgi:5'(3')-deoxyribonucleotidase